MSRHGVVMDSLEMVVPQFLAGNRKSAHDEYEKALEPLEASHNAGIRAQWRDRDSTREAASSSQRRLASLIMRLSPVGSFSMLATALAGTGLDEWDRSLAFAWTFQDRVTGEVYDKWIVRPYGANRTVTMPAERDCPPAVERAGLHAILTPASPSERIEAGTPDMLILAGMTLLAGAGCWLKFRSYDAR